LTVEKRLYRSRANSVALSRAEWALMVLALLLGVSGLLVSITSTSHVGAPATGVSALIVAVLVTRGMTRNS
jgi:hypothetical protein